jgi:hypothetical protein
VQYAEGKKLITITCHDDIFTEIFNGSFVNCETVEEMANSGSQKNKPYCEAMLRVYKEKIAK